MIGGVVLAAGEATRFGGPKQLAELDGRPLLEHALRSVSAVPAIDRIVVVLGAHAKEIRAKVDFLDTEPIVCEDWREGQAASLRAGLAALGDVEAALITLGDQPRITPQVIAMALDDFDGRRPVRMTYDGQPGHPVVLPAGMIPRVMELEGDVGARHLLEQARVREVEAGHLASAADVDTPADLEVLRR
ncbi:MAG: nucleotidyltransferase family protein [Thermoleophilaceae bacterium]